MRNATLILGLMLFAGTSYAACGVQDERAAYQSDQVVQELGHTPAMVIAARLDPVTGIVADLVTVSRVEFHAGTLAPAVLRGVDRKLPVAHSSGGMPG